MYKCVSAGKVTAEYCRFVLVIQERLILIVKGNVLKKCISVE